MTVEADLTLGEFLRQERERRGITIEQVASATKIAIRLLHSLEADQYADLPAKPFVRGFVTSYARFIGLDPKEILTRFGNFIDKKAHDRPTKEEGHSGYVFERREGEQSRTILWFVMGGFVVFGGLIFIFLKPSLRHGRGSHVEKLRTAHTVVAPSASPVVAVLTKVVKKDVEATPSPKPMPTPSGVPVAAAEAEKEKEKDPLNSGKDLKKEEIHHRVFIRALADVWVRFQVDEKKMMKFVMRKDKVLILLARDKIRFQSSDPKSIRFNYNNSSAKIMEEEKNVAMRQGDATLFFPPQLAETIQEPFPGTRVLLNAPVPPPAQPIPQ